MLVALVSNFASDLDTRRSKFELCHTAAMPMCGKTRKSHFRHAIVVVSANFQDFVLVAAATD